MKAEKKPKKNQCSVQLSTECGPRRTPWRAARCDSRLRPAGVFFGGLVIIPKLSSPRILALWRRVWAEDTAKQRPPLSDTTCSESVLTDSKSVVGWRKTLTPRDSVSGRGRRGGGLRGECFPAQAGWNCYRRKTVPGCEKPIESKFRPPTPSLDRPTRLVRPPPAAAQRFPNADIRPVKVGYHFRETEIYSIILEVRLCCLA